MNKQKVGLLIEGLIVLCLIAGIIINLPRDKLLKYMKTISGSKTISGADVHYTGSDRYKGVETIQKITGTSPGVLVLVMPLYSESILIWQVFVDEIISNWKNGYLMHIIWGWVGNPLILMDVFKATGNMVHHERKWTDLITDGGELNKEWKKQLDALVPHFYQLESAGVVVFCSLLPDINYKNYLWRGRPGVNGSLRLYQITHDYFTEHHPIKSILWTWHLNDFELIEQYWPGNHYVDMVSVIMGSKRPSALEYQTLLSVVGDTPISMHYNYVVPTPQYFALQPRWAWFSLSGKDILSYNNAESLNSTFHISIVVNKGDNQFFKHGT